MASARLAVTSLPASAAGPKHLVMLHGIFGRGRNWRAIADAIVLARPEYTCWLVDLPHHGDSGPGAHGDTVKGLAMDVSDWLASQGVAPNAILGHSYGGKVALAIAAAMPDAALQVWVIDSTPETRSPSGSAWDMLRVVRGLPAGFGAREDVIEPLVAAGYAPAIAKWMSTNLVREADGFVWRLDFDAMERLMLDFFATDLWPVVERPSARHDIHFLKASRSSVISPEAASRISAAPRDSVHLHRMEGGHWIHAEAPAAVASLVADTLP